MTEITIVFYVKKYLKTAQYYGILNSPTTKYGNLLDLIFTQRILQWSRAPARVSPGRSRHRGSRTEYGKVLSHIPVGTENERGRAPICLVPVSRQRVQRDQAFFLTEWAKLR